MTPLKTFALGALMMAFLVAGMFFARFYRKTRDRLFGGFAIAFFVLSANQFAFLEIDERSSARTVLYVVRLIAFSIILVAIIDKNRASR